MNSTIEIVIQKAADIATDASHGYDQSNRWGPDYDCSSFVITCWKEAGIPLTCTYTGNMYNDMISKGFRDVTAEVNLNTAEGMERGDVLLNIVHHTALYCGSGLVFEAAGNEFGGIRGGQTGDQANEIGTNSYRNYPWDCVLRYAAEEDELTEDGEAVYTVQEGDNLWSIAEKKLGNPLLWEKIRQLNGLKTLTIYPGERLIMPEETVKICPTCGIVY